MRERKHKLLFFVVLLLTLCMTTRAQMVEPIHTSAEMKILDGIEAELLFHLKMDAGWHVYSPKVTSGPIAASFHADKMQGAKVVGPLRFRGKEITKYDNAFEQELQFFENSVTFVQHIRLMESKYDIDCYLEYGACNDKMCLPPSEIPLKVKGDRPAADSDERSARGEQPEATIVPNETDTPAKDTAKAAVEAVEAIDSTEAIEATETIANSDTIDAKGGESHSLLYTFFAGLLGGLLALLTPCVWPIIPMTVSFFLKRNKERSKAIREALTYGLSIIVIYVVLGLLVTLLFGANALNALSTNAWFNIFFALLLVVFAASFFGAFELTLPSSWANKVDQKSEKLSTLNSQLSTFLSIFLMAFTLALVSFSCTGPIIGFLLVAVGSQGELLGPTIGMLGFATGLAIPFALFALFPSLLKSVPKSGGWMNVVKVTLGFIELAFALKFFSVADLAYGWHLLDREVFLALWIVIFGLLGFYLLGIFHFPHDDKQRTTNVPQFFMALASLAFAVYMIPGLWGAPLRAISAFAPPMSTQDFKLQEEAVTARFNDYEQGLAAARQEGKPVIIDFTGYGCVNCRKMEGAVWSQPQVADVLNNDYVLISLYVDDKTALDSVITVTENGQERKLRTVGDKWSYLQRTKFGANTQPYYVLLDNDGQPLNGYRSYDEDVQAYLDWLNDGLTKFKK